MLCSEVAESLECEFLVATERDSVLFALEHRDVEVVLIDAATIPGYLSLLTEIKQRTMRIEMLIVDEKAGIAAAVEAIKAGAADYLSKPFDAATLERALSDALRRYRAFQASVIPLQELEKQAIQHAMVQAEGNKLEAARLLSIGKTTLYRKLREYGNSSTRRPHRNAKKDTGAA